MKPKRITFRCKICNKPFSYREKVVDILRQGNAMQERLDYCNECRTKKGRLIAK
jgi:hypothetical protein